MRPGIRCEPSAPRRGLTLIEILVATALGMVIVAMTWTAFAQAKSTVARSQARVGMHYTASVLQDTLERDFGHLAPSLALFARSSPTASGTTRSEDIEIVFMRSTAPLDKQMEQSTYDRYLADHHWVRWHFARTLAEVDGTWKVRTAALTRSASTPIRHWQTTAALSPGGPVWDPLGDAFKTTYKGTHWINIPRPLRDASGGIASLDNNRYGLPPGAISPDTPIGDIGDLQDLLDNDRMTSVQVRDFRFGWVEASGQAVTLDGRIAATHDIHGLYPDLVGPDNGRYLDRRQDPRSSAPGSALNPAAPQYDYRPDLSRRPRLMRIAMRLEDATTHLSQTFTWSIAVPGLMPPLAPSP